jgi:GNAT superfamily N-acetyltransferase
MRTSSIRPARPEDVQLLIANVLAGFEGYRAFAPPGWSPPPEDILERRTELADRTRDRASLVCVAEVDGVFAGHVTVVPGQRPSRDGTVPDFHLRHLFVTERFWGTGVARELHAEAIAFMSGVCRLFTPELQGRARRFYEREGWTQHGEPYFEQAMGLALVEYRRR